MKLICIYLYFLCIFLQPAVVEKCTLEVNIVNFKSDEGKLLIALYKGSDTFMNEGKAWQKKIGEIKNKACKVTFTDLPAGEYAFSFFHDQNGNAKMDKKFFGIPKEGVGFSNNPKMTFGPPSYNQCKIVLGSGKKTVEAKLVHF